MEWSEAGLPPVSRTYHVHVPKSIKPGRPTPLLLVFHGWGETGKGYYSNYNFDKLGEKEGFIGVYLEGMSDCAAGDEGKDCQGKQSWNGGGTVASKNTLLTCSPEKVSVKACYSSCVAKKGSCHACDWTTCYDDVGFISKLLQDLRSSHCVDTSRTYAYGCSNGGIFLHELARRLPGAFTGIAAVCGGKPMQGFTGGLPTGGPPLDVLMTVGNEDDVIPRNRPPPGTSWWDGYYYAGEAETLNAYKVYNGCKTLAPTTFKSEYAANGLECTTVGSGCRGGARVVSCVFPGKHDIFDHKGSDGISDGSQAAWDFFQKRNFYKNYLGSVASRLNLLNK
jgi:polyhydroxybutyrate depolymerase